jgi:membrane protein implicated in regulation of membrane protease activity
MSAYWVWWIAAAVLVGAELVTGTFYLLVVGIAAALGGIAAWLGAGVPVQFLLAGGCAFVLTFVAHQWRQRQAPQSPEVALDVGQMVQVQTWNADGTARVEHRGTQWDAELASPDTPRGATLYIVATRGSVLVLSDRRPAA